MTEDAPFLTRRQAVELIRSELGVPLGLSKIEKDAMDGRGPTPRARYGRHFLYDRADVLAYGRSLIERVAHERQTRCAGGPVIFYRLVGGGHDIPAALKASQTLLDFFRDKMR